MQLAMRNGWLSVNLAAAVGVCVCVCMTLTGCSLQLQLAEYDPGSCSWLCV